VAHGASRVLDDATVTPRARTGPSSEPADVVIVGAGISGGVVGRRLAEAGFSVVCLEQGDWHDRSEFPGQRPDWELALRKQWSANPNTRRLSEDYPIDSSASEVEPLMYNAVGGSTILYAADWARLAPSDFKTSTLDGVGDDWPIDYEALQPFYDRTDRDMGVSGLAGNPAYPSGADPPLPPLPIGESGMWMARAHTRLGWHWWPGTNAILSAPYEGRRPCVQWGACMQGCPEGAKASADLTHWPAALASGAQLITGARVTRIAVNSHGLATGVTWMDRSGKESFQAGRVVVLAANAIGTARLLLVSAQRGHPDGLANTSGLVGRRLMMHPFAAVTGVFDQRLETWKGHVGCRISSMQFYESDQTRGFVRGAKWSMAPSTGGPVNAAMPSRAGEVCWGREHHQRVRSRFGHCLSWGIFGEDLPAAENRVELHPELRDGSGLPAPKVTYRVSSNTRRLLEFHVARASESLLEAGAHTIESSQLLRESGWHLMGTARMGEDPDDSVVDPFGRSHEVANLFVVDGSLFVTSGGVNPTSTICALALRCAERMIESRRGQKTPV
jgi:choline dehydrogenase-like flavoprotein